MTTPYRQEPIAVVGMSCRLPGNSNSPHALWKLLEAGLVARNDPPSTRFTFKHYDGSCKPKTMQCPGGMFLENIDPADFDAMFFAIAAKDAISIDPQQRQLLEVVYECLENAGIPLESLIGSSVGCFVGASTNDYQEMQARDPDDTVPGLTLGTGTALLSNRLSHWLDIKGPSMTIDTACSGSLVSLDVACRYLQTREISGAIVGGASLYLDPHHAMDVGAMKTATSASGKCHTWDSKADGYVKAEGINAVFLKRLEDAIRDGDPIRAVIRGTATNSNGRTPGIASPSSEAQAAAIRAAYQNAGITDFDDTSYLECHGTGTKAGDPTELIGVASVFCAKPRKADLLIGSIKSNIGHSEPAAGISGLLKAILTLEHDKVPGNPTFIDPDPAINFKALQLQPSRSAIPWPEVSFKRASVNSFGFGGANVHCVVDAYGQATHKSSYRFTDNFDDFLDDTSTDDVDRPYTLVFSANDEASLRGWVSNLASHLMSPEVVVQLPDLAFTLSERRSRFFNRGYVVARTVTGGLDVSGLITGKPDREPPMIGFVFTGQGAQWSQMGKQLIETFPEARSVIDRLDEVLQQTPCPPSWSLFRELTEPRDSQHLQRPEISQPIVTALQLAMLYVMRDCWGLKPQAVVGHSSGDIAAAFAAGYLDEANAIKAAFYRGQAAKNETACDVGMLAVGLGADVVSKYILPVADRVHIACYNSPNSVTLSGTKSALEDVKAALLQDEHFARFLRVDLAYHSKYMRAIGERYKDLLDRDFEHVPSRVKKTTSWFSSVTGDGRRSYDQATASYWKANMVSPVLFNSAVREMISGKTGCSILVEIGPSGALAGPIAQIKNDMKHEEANVKYYAALNRGKNSINAMFDVAGHLFVAGAAIDLAKVNGYAKNPSPPAVIVDLPNYSWNHGMKYWHESDASRNYRFREFSHHDLIGSKVINTTYDSPIWRKLLAVEDLPWLRDHKMGPDIVFPAAGFLAMAIEGLHQVVQAQAASGESRKPSFRVRNSKFTRALVLEEGRKANVMLALTKSRDIGNPWYEFTIRSKTVDVWDEHCRGLIRTEFKSRRNATQEELAPLQYASRGNKWYKVMNDAGYGFGPSFQKIVETECTSGKRTSRSIIDLAEPRSAYIQSSYYMHPATMDGCLQACGSALWSGRRSDVNAVLIPAMIEDLVVCARTEKDEPTEGLALASSRYAGVGREQLAKNYTTDITVYDPVSGVMLFQAKGLRHNELDMGNIGASEVKYTKLQWAPDMDFLTQDQLNFWLASSSSRGLQAINQVLDAVAHKKPSLNVAEFCLVRDDSSSIWLGAESSIRKCCSRFVLASPDAKALVTIQEQHPAAKVHLFDPCRPLPEGFSNAGLDLVILKVEAQHPDFQNHLGVVRPFLDEGGHILLLEYPSSDSSCDVSEAKKRGADFLEEANFHQSRVVCLETEDTMLQGHLATACTAAEQRLRPIAVTVVHFDSDDEQLNLVLDDLASFGWKFSHCSISDDLPSNNEPLLILAELVNPLLARITDVQWEALKRLLASYRQILWVTQGSQMRTTNPENAMIHGLLRTVRAEDPLARITTLDVESAAGEATVSSIDKILQHILTREPLLADSEFVERDGMIHVSRVLPNATVNHFSYERSHGRDLVDMSLQKSPSTVRLVSERVGTLDALQFSEIDEVPLGDNSIEVEIEAAGLNFKDLAIVMGIVPENEHLLGLEGAGTVRRSSSPDYAIGDRVVLMPKGTFANRVVATADRAHRIPDWMTFEEAATLGSVYLTALYSLYELGNTQSGQRVLIHSATGGLGIACIQVCKHIGAEIYATAGSDSKRKFLTDEFGIPPEHIFNSRTIEFAEALMIATDHQGVDVIINTLTGDLLDESWRCIRYGGTMIELGKKDMLEQNTLSMEPFGRNASYKCFDMGHKNVSDHLIAKLLKQLMSLVEQRSVTPITPMKIFPFDQIPEAFRYMRKATHMGKIVVSMQAQKDVVVKARPSPWKLRMKPDVSYLIIGGLKGICGSLAIQLARRGAKHLVVMARSGFADGISQATIKNIESEGSQVHLVTGDVTNIDDVRTTFRDSCSKWPIAGIIQGAMVLRDKVFTSMTIEEYRQCVASKLEGTWNLHNVAIEHALDLDFFTMLSSISGVVGQRGQANYAAANVFLDAFAAYRRQKLGLRAVSVDLGAIQDVGYISRNDQLLERLDAGTWTLIDERRLLGIVEQSIMQQLDPACSYAADDSQLTSGISVPLSEDSPLLTGDVRFAGLRFGGHGDGSRNAAEIDLELSAFLLLARSESKESNRSQILALCLSVVSRQFEKTLRLPEPIEPDKALSSYGLDSLAAVELRNWARKDMSADLTILDITNAATLTALCEKIVAKVQVISTT